MAGKVFVVNSGKGGVGKTTTTANIGSALALMGHRVALVDADIGLRNLDVVMGLENRIVYDLTHAIEGECEPAQAMIRDKRTDNLFVIPASQSRDKESVDGEQMKAFCEQLRAEFDYVFIDSPAGIEQGFRNAMAAADSAIVVTTPDVAAIRDADRVIGFIEASGMEKPKLIINRVRPAMVKRGDMMTKDDILDLLAVPLLGMIPEDEKIVISTNRGVPIVHDGGSRSGASFRELAARIEGREVPMQSVEVSNGIFGWFKRVVGFQKSPARAKA